MCSFCGTKKLFPPFNFFYPFLNCVLSIPVFLVVIDLLVQLVIFKIQIKVFMIFLSFTLSFKTHELLIWKFLKGRISLMRCCVKFVYRPKPSTLQAGWRLNMEHGTWAPQHGKLVPVANHYKIQKHSRTKHCLSPRRKARSW